MSQPGVTVRVFDPLHPAPGESVDLFREKLRDRFDLSGKPESEWRAWCLLAGIPPFPGDSALL